MRISGGGNWPKKNPERPARVSCHARRHCSLLRAGYRGSSGVASPVPRESCSDNGVISVAVIAPQFILTQFMPFFDQRACLR